MEWERMLGWCRWQNNGKMEWERMLGGCQWQSGGKTKMRSSSSGVGDDAGLLAKWRKKSNQTTLRSGPESSSHHSTLGRSEQMIQKESGHTVCLLQNG